MSEVPTLLVSLVFAVLAVWFRLTPEDRMKGSQSVSACMAGFAIGMLVVALIASVAR